MFKNALRKTVFATTLGLAAFNAQAADCQHSGSF
ncbi:hypothetical protein XMA127_001171 [Marinobacterium sp. xm-a-127]|jgi:hypothetical protein|nr:hypothetical protein [Marinobacterium sp. xm-d-510]NRP97428.1 hypothetical protein [Marinobacterium sp. xm-a-127]